MAKLNKEKFTLNANVKERTTSTGDIELQLYYDTTYHNFYFELDDLKNYFNINNINFRHCKDRQMALDMVKILIEEKIVWTRKLRIELKMDTSLVKEKNKFSERLLRCSYHGDKNILGIQFDRLLCTEFNGQFYYKECNEKWNPRPEIDYGKSGIIIDYSEQTELLLMSIQNQIKNASLQMLEFFNAENEKALFDKIQNNNSFLMLNDNNQNTK